MCGEMTTIEREREARAPLWVPANWQGNQNNTLNSGGENGAN